MFLFAGTTICQFYSRKIKELLKIENQLSELGNIRAIKCDVTSQSDVIRLFCYLERKVGRLGTWCRLTQDILVNNAGSTWGAPLSQYTDEAFNKILKVNLGRFILQTLRIGFYDVSVDGASTFAIC